MSNSGTDLQYPSLIGKLLSLTEGTVKESDLISTSNLDGDEDLFTYLSNISPAGMYITDSKGKCIFVNQKWSEMSGLTLEEAQGYGWKAALHPDDRDRIFKEWNRSVDSDGDWLMEYRFINKESGKITWVAGSAKAIMGQDGNTKGYLGMNIDITKRKVYEQTQEKLLGDMQEAMGEIKTMRGFLGVCACCHKVLDSDGQWVYMERYIEDHTEARLSHGFCPDCFDKQLTEIGMEGSPRGTIENALGERVKELRCLHRLSATLSENILVDDMIYGVIALLPPAWQYPEFTYARIVIGDKSFVTDNYRTTEWSQSAIIKCSGIEYGTIEVGYLKKFPEEQEGVFLREERELIDNIAERIGSSLHMRHLQEIVAGIKH